MFNFAQELGSKKYFTNLVVSTNNRLCFNVFGYYNLPMEKIAIVKNGRH